MTYLLKLNICRKTNINIFLLCLQQKLPYENKGEIQKAIRFQEYEVFDAWIYKSFKSSIKTGEKSSLHSKLKMPHVLLWLFNRSNFMMCYATSDTFRYSCYALMPCSITHFPLRRRISKMKLLIPIYSLKLWIWPNQNSMLVSLSYWVRSNKSPVSMHSKSGVF